MICDLAVLFCRSLVLLDSFYFEILSVLDFFSSRFLLLLVLVRQRFRNVSLSAFLFFPLFHTSFFSISADTDMSGNHPLPLVFILCSFSILSSLVRLCSQRT